MNTFGTTLAGLVSSRLLEGDIYWSGGGMGSRSDGLVYDEDTKCFIYGLIEEGSLLSTFEAYKDRESFEAWLSGQSNESMVKRVEALGERSSLLTKEGLEFFVNQASVLDSYLSNFSEDAYGSELATSAAEKIMREDFRAPFIWSPVSDGFHYSSEDRSFVFCLFLKGKVDTVLKSFTSREVFVAWLALQSDRAMASRDPQFAPFISKLTLKQLD